MAFLSPYSTWSKATLPLENKKPKQNKKNNNNKKTRIVVSTIKAWTLWKTYTATDLLRHFPAHCQCELQLELLFSTCLRPGLLELWWNSRGRSCWRQNPANLTHQTTKRYNRFDYSSTQTIPLSHRHSQRSPAQQQDPWVPGTTDLPTTISFPQLWELKLVPRLRLTSQNN